MKNTAAYGIVPVAAPRNGDGRGNPLDACTMMPARVPGTISISDTYHPNSSYGRGQRVNRRNYGSCVNWFAPGHHVCSAYRRSSTDYYRLKGTSMAAPARG